MYWSKCISIGANNSMTAGCATRITTVTRQTGLCRDHPSFWS
jgi:hypothetical protein